MITRVFAYNYCGLAYYNIYRDNVFQFQGTDEDYYDYLEILENIDNL